MSKTERRGASDRAEMTHKWNPEPPPSGQDDSDYAWLLYLATLPPETWPAEALKLLGQHASVAPWRRHRGGDGIEDWGAVPGTKVGAHRYYWAATRDRDCLQGTMVANSARAVERWLRDSERADGYASRDPRAISYEP